MSHRAELLCLIGADKVLTAWATRRAVGLLGLFVGPVLLAVSYVLLLEWLRQHPAGGGPQIDGSAARPSSESSGLPIE